MVFWKQPRFLSTISGFMAAFQTVCLPKLQLKVLGGEQILFVPVSNAIFPGLALALRLKHYEDSGSCSPDSGLLHALLSILDKETLLSHPVIGQSRECFAIENILTAAPDDVQGYFYRTGGGAEIDLFAHLAERKLMGD